MGTPKAHNMSTYQEDELLDYSSDEEKNLAHPDPKHHVGIHTYGFKDFLLKPELMRTIQDCGFEHPSEVQAECVPQAILGMDVLCQAKSGMGKTAVTSPVSVLDTPQRLGSPVPASDPVIGLAVCGTTPEYHLGSLA